MLYDFKRFSAFFTVFSSCHHRSTNRVILEKLEKLLNAFRVVNAPFFLEKRKKSLKEKAGD